MPPKRDKVELYLEGAEATKGLPLDTLASFVNEFRAALRDFDRARRAERTRRGGHPTSREDLVTSFRLVAFRTGSAVLELEAFAPERGEADQEALDDVEKVAVENLRALLDSLASEDEPIDEAVVQSVEAARRTLGEGGRIRVDVRSGSRRKRSLTIDERRGAALQRRVRRYAPGVQAVSGRLHAIDIEPDTVRIRTAQGVDWICRYSSEHEATVMALIGSVVAARGHGQLQSSNLGRMTITAVEALPQFEQSELFSLEPVTLDELVQRHAAAHARGPVSIIPDEATDEEVDAFLNALDAM